MDETTAVHPAQLPPARTHVTVTPTSGLERAQVKWFNRLRGFGFLTRGEGTPDIFVHMETLRRFGLAELRPGQFVLVRFGPGPKGLMAAEVRPEGAGARSGLPLTPPYFSPFRVSPRISRPLPARLAFSPFRPARGSRLAAAADETVEIVSRTGVHAFAVEMAVNDEDRARGLMYRRELPEGRGMLFDFNREQVISMWMQNTYIPLDMIFIRGDGRILSIAENTEPLSTRVLSSGGPARAVLEVIGGTAKKLGIRPGRPRGAIRYFAGR